MRCQLMRACHLNMLGMFIFEARIERHALRIMYVSVPPYVIAFILRIFCMLC